VVSFNFKVEAVTLEIWQRHLELLYRPSDKLAPPKESASYRFLRPLGGSPGSQLCKSFSAWHQIVSIPPAPRFASCRTPDSHPAGGKPIRKDFLRPARACLMACREAPSASCQIFKGDASNFKLGHHRRGGKSMPARPAVRSRQKAGRTIHVPAPIQNANSNYALLPWRP